MDSQESRGHLPADSLTIRYRTRYFGDMIAATSLIAAAAASVWLFSPLRLQAEMGVFLILLALASTLIPLRLQRVLSLESGVRSPESGGQGVLS